MTFKESFDAGTKLNQLGVTQIFDDSDSNKSKFVRPINDDSDSDDKSDSE